MFSLLQNRGPNADKGAASRRAAPSLVTRRAALFAIIDDFGARAFVAPPARSTVLFETFGD